MDYKDLTKEQQLFIDYAMKGYNILVDACIGSGKTTAIQTLCSQMAGKRILYLTYNKLLKLDAKERIQNGYVTVTNYHGFAFTELMRMNIKPGLSELIQVYNRAAPPCSVQYDVLVLDEYQDIEQEIADMLEHIKECCPGIQLIAVGDMQQKIYDKTNLNVQEFITKFLGNYLPMEFTTCFRINKAHAEMLGRIWNKPIVGVNEDFTIVTMFEHEIRKLIPQFEPRQLMVLGAKAGDAKDLQNYLESRHQDKFNKRTLWSKIWDNEGSTNPTPDCAIFTTYDGCKGMERDVCVLYDWSMLYWWTRLNKPDVQYEILRNIFCVAASRAKKLLIIADTDSPVTEEELSTPSEQAVRYQDMNISEMFDFKFIEDVEDAYAALDITEFAPIQDIIDIPMRDALIDLSPCIGHYQEAMYFKGYDIDRDLEYNLQQPGRSHMRRQYAKYTLGQKLLYLSTLETRQQRYMNQVKQLPVTGEHEKALRERISKYLPETADVQEPCSIVFYDSEGCRAFSANGLADAVKDGVVYELKYASALSHVHALQLAMYLVCMNAPVGRLFNTRTGQVLEIRVPDKGRFLDKVARAVTKGRFQKFYKPNARAIV